jgi:hypothetical protein
VVVEAGWVGGGLHGEAGEVIMHYPSSPQIGHLCSGLSAAMHAYRMGI